MSLVSNFVNRLSKLLWEIEDWDVVVKLWKEGYRYLGHATCLSGVEIEEFGMVESGSSESSMFGIIPSLSFAEECQDLRLRCSAYTHPLWWRPFGSNMHFWGLAEFDCSFHSEIANLESLIACARLVLSVFHICIDQASIISFAAAGELSRGF
jgi:hypothetical protein